ncbi:GSCOCG00002159001-RA-CDS, partial [Cotesia congregata]
RFQQTNQSLRCYVMYTDFYRCEKILGENEKACQWFKDTFQALCPKDWIERWDSLRALNPPKFYWHKERTQGKFPGRSYGD